MRRAGAERRSAPGPTPERCAPCWNAAQSRNLENYPPPPSPPARCSAGWAQNSGRKWITCKVVNPLRGAAAAAGARLKAETHDGESLAVRTFCAPPAMFELTSCGVEVFFTPSSSFFFFSFLSVLLWSPQEDVPPLPCCFLHLHHPLHRYDNLTWWDYDPTGIKTRARSFTRRVFGGVSWWWMVSRYL